MKKKLLKYTQIAKVAAQEKLVNSSGLIARLLIHILRINLFGVIYSYVYDTSGKQNINSITKLEVIWALAFVQLIYQSTRGAYKLVREQILTGQIETKINKPYSYRVYSFFESFGYAPIVFTIYLAFTVLSLGILFGIPNFEISQLIAIPILFLIGSSISISIQQTIALVGFWLENPDPVNWILTKLSWIVNGTFVPVSIMPRIFRLIAAFFPLSMPFLIGRIFEMDTSFEILKFLVIQVCWLILTITTQKIIYNKGRKIISISGS